MNKKQRALCNKRPTKRDRAYTEMRDDTWLQVLEYAEYYFVLPCITFRIWKRLIAPADRAFMTEGKNAADIDWVAIVAEAIEEIDSLVEQTTGAPK